MQSPKKSRTGHEPLTIKATKEAHETVKFYRQREHIMKQNHSVQIQQKNSLVDHITNKNAREMEELRRKHQDEVDELRNLLETAKVHQP